MIGKLMKRFTDTNLWDKAWFMDLTADEKCAFFYLKDKCDNVGVWCPNFQLANFMVGKKIKWNILLEKTNGNVIVLDNGKWWIKDFCRFQYGRLRFNCNPHVSYMKLLEEHRLWQEYLKTIGTLKDKDKDKDKDIDIDKDKDKDKEQEKEKDHFVPKIV